MVAVLVVVGALASAAPARANEGNSRPVLLTLDPGICLLHSFESSTSSYGQLFLAYLGGTLQLDLPGPLAANAFVGIFGCYGLSAGGTIRYAAKLSGATRLTAGVGPMIATVPGWTALAEGDVALEIRSGSGFELVVGPKLMVTLERSGVGEICPLGRPTDCVAPVPPGTYSVLFRLGLGFNL